ncbi:hypothetical protein HC776_01010 [bacterium]|nr:hypothetical protein [bacterium]
MIGQWLKAHRAVIGVVALVLLLALPVLSYPLWRDHGMYGNIARTILAGGTPYIDMWDIKPPPIYYLYAASIAFVGPTTAAPRVLDLIGFVLAAPALYALARRLAGDQRVGVWAVFTYGVFYFTETYASLSQSDSLVTIPMIYAALCARLAADSHGRKALIWALAAGAVCGLILWFKHYYLFFILALVLEHVIRRGGAWRTRAFWQEVAAFAAGGLLTGGGVWLYTVSRGMWAEMLIIAQGTAAYNALGYDVSEFIAAMRNYVSFRWSHWGAMLILVALWPLGHWLTMRPTRQKISIQTIEIVNSGGLRFVVLWSAAGLAFMLIQAKGFDTHWLPMLPPLALVAAASLVLWTDILSTYSLRQPQRAGVWALLTAPRMGQMAVALLFVGIVLNSTWGRALPSILGGENQVEYFLRFREGGDVEPAQSLQLVQYLQQRVVPGDSIYIWGFRPEVAYMGGWRPATRYQAQFPLVAPWYPHTWQQNNVDILWAALPPYIVVLQTTICPGSQVSTRIRINCLFVIPS